MKKIKDFITKFRYFFIIIIILIIIILLFYFSLISNRSVATETNTYSRQDLQKMLISAALSYYYNNYYSDYEQYLLDADVKYPDISNNNSCVLDYEKNTNCVSKKSFYPLVSTTFYDNLNISPEDVSRSNMYNIACSAFTYLIYSNVLGYNMSEFYSLYGTANTTKITKTTENGEIIYKPDKIRAISSLDTFNDAITKYGRAWATTGILTRVSNCIAQNNGDRTKCLFTSALDGPELKAYDIINSKKGKDGIYIDKDNKSEIVFNYNFENLTYKDANNYNKYLDEWNSIIEYFTKGNEKYLLQKGDIIKIQYKSAGHAMFYVEDVLNSNDSGIIHATGVDGSYDSFSIRYESSIVNYLNSRKNKHKNEGDTNRIINLTIIRPLNVYCGNTNTCTNNNITQNDKARVAFSGTRVEQYVKKDGRGISIYNSVDVGDTITYGLSLEDKRGYGYCSDSSKNKSGCVSDDSKERQWISSGNAYDNVKNKKFIVKFTAPEGTRIIKYPSKYTCKTSSSNEITCEGTDRYPTFNVIVDSSVSSKLEAGKFEVSYKDNDKSSSLNTISLKLNTISLNVNRTINPNDVNNLMNTINTFKNKNYKHNDKDQITSKDSINTATSFSSLDFIKYIYYNNFHIDLSELTGENIINSLFYSWNGYYSQYLSGTSAAYNLSAFFKKDEEKTNTISNMLVDGMYGGKKLIGNENKKRIKYIHNRYLEIGDIIVVSNKFIDNFDHSREGTAQNYSLTTVNPSELEYYLVTSFDKDGYPTLISFNKNGLDTCSKESKKFDGEGNYLLNTGGSYYCSFRVIKHLLFSSNLFAVLRPTQVYNDAEYGISAYVDGYPAKGTVVKYNDKYSEKIQTPYKKGYDFDGWYLDPDYKTKVTNVRVHSNHKIYGKFKEVKYKLTINPNGGNYSGSTTIDVLREYTYTLPTITRDGYTFVKWEVSGKGSSVNNNIFTMGNESASVKAIWKEEKEISFDSSLLVDRYNNIINDIKPGTTIGSIADKITTNGTITLYDNNKNKIGREEKVNNGYIISIKYSASVDEYVLFLKNESNNNPSLKSLTVKGAKINFNSEKLTYDLVVNSDKTTISAVAVSTTSKVDGTGEKKLEFGKNTFNVVVTNNGEKKIYTLSITRYDTDNTLKSIKINNKEIIVGSNSSFSITTKLDNINIQAVSNSKRVKNIAGTGDIAINYGANEINIDVIAESGSSRVYKLIVNRPSDNNLSELSINGEKISLQNDNYYYDYEIENNVDKVVVDAVLSDKNNEFVSEYGPRTIDNLDIKNTKSELKIKGQDGKEVVYIINIIKKEKEIIDEQVENVEKSPKINYYFYAISMVILIAFGLILNKFMKRK
ncbi:MAG: InlB B-repeat-containing protein [Bacilli bacterium]